MEKYHVFGIFWHRKKKSTSPENSIEKLFTRSPPSPPGPQGSPSRGCGKRCATKPKFLREAKPPPDPNLALQQSRIFRQNRQCDARAFSPKSERATLKLIGPAGLQNGISLPSKHFNSFSKSLAKLHLQLAPVCYNMVIGPRTLQNENKMRNVCTPDFFQKCGMRASANLNPKMHKACIFVPG